MGIPLLLTCGCITIASPKEDRPFFRKKMNVHLEG